MTFLSLDHFIFGNGRGLGSPYFDSTFYWLNGQLYTWIGGFGAQLQSFEWFKPSAGTRRRLLGHDFVIFQVERRWFRVRASWACTQVNTIGEIRALKEELRRI